MKRLGIYAVTLITGFFLQACSPTVTPEPVSSTTKKTVLSSDEKDNAPLELTSITPSKQIVGGTIILKGKGLTSAVQILVGGVEIADYMIISSKAIVAVLPEGVKSGDVDVFGLDGEQSTLKNAFTLIQSSHGSPSPSPSPSTPQELINRSWIIMPVECDKSSSPPGESNVQATYVDIDRSITMRGIAYFTNDSCSGDPSTIASDGIEKSQASLTWIDLQGSPAGAFTLVVKDRKGNYLGEVWRTTPDPNYFDLVMIAKNDGSWPSPDYSWGEWKSYYKDVLNDSSLDDFEKSDPGKYSFGVRVFHGYNYTNPSASPSPSTSSSASPSPSPSPSPKNSWSQFIAEDPNFAFYEGDANYQTARVVLTYPVGGPSPIYTSTCGVDSSKFLINVYAPQTAPNGVFYAPVTYTINGDTSSISDGANCTFSVRDTGDSNVYSISFIFHRGTGPSPSPSPSTNWWDAFAPQSSSNSSSSSSTSTSSSSYSSSSSSDSSLNLKVTSLNQMTIARTGHTSVRLQNDKILLIGGLSSHSDPLSSVELYDRDGNGSGGMSTVLTSLPAAMAPGHTSTLLNDGSVLIVGGTTVYRYTPASGGSVTTLTSTSSYHSHHTATLLPSGKVLIAGGTNSNVVELYDAAGSGSTTVLTPLNQASQYHTATLLPDGKILIAGGWYSGGNLNRVELYDPSGSGSSTSLTSMSTTRVQHTATLLANGKILVAGGVNDASETATVELYDPYGNSGNGSTQSLGNMTEARASHTATLLGNGKVLFAGGQGMGNLSSAEIYNPIPALLNHETTAIASMPNSHLDHSAILLKNGEVLILGGGSTDGSTGTTNVESYSLNDSPEMIYSGVYNQGTLNIGDTKTFALEGGSGDYTFLFNCAGIFSHSVNTSGVIYITANSAGSCGSFTVLDNTRNLSALFSIQVKNSNDLNYGIASGSTSFAQAGDILSLNFYLNKNSISPVYMKESSPCTSQYFDYDPNTLTLSYLGGLGAQKFTCYFSDQNDGSIKLAIPISTDN